MVDHKSLQAFHNGYWPGICFISLIIIVVIVVALLVVMFLVIIIMVKNVFHVIITNVQVKTFL